MEEAIHLTNVAQVVLLLQQNRAWYYAEDEGRKLVVRDHRNGRVLATAPSVLFDTLFYDPAVEVVTINGSTEARPIQRIYAKGGIPL